MEPSLPPTMEQPTDGTPSSLPQTVPSTPPPSGGYLEQDYGNVQVVSNVGIAATAFGLILLCLGVWAMVKARGMNKRGKS